MTPAGNLTSGQARSPTPLALNHVGITVPDIFAAIDWCCELCADVDGLVDRIAARGGRRHSDTHALAPGRPWRLAHARDPWWTTIEIVSHSYAAMFSNWPQPGAETKPEFVDRDAAIRLRAMNRSTGADATSRTTP